MKIIPYLCNKFLRLIVYKFYLNKDFHILVIGKKHRLVLLGYIDDLRQVWLLSQKKTGEYVSISLSFFMEGNTVLSCEYSNS